MGKSGTINATSIGLGTGAYNSLSGLQGLMKTRGQEGGQGVTDGIGNKLPEVRGKVAEVEGSISGSRLRFPEIQWPTIRVPKFHMNGSFSLNPPSVPSISVDWAWQGGIYNNPTLLGVGDKYKGRGSNPEAVVPLNQLYKEIDRIISSKVGDDQGSKIIIEKIEINPKSSDAQEIGRVVENKIRQLSLRL
jgi:hypothetical protein